MRLMGNVVGEKLNYKIFKSGDVVSPVQTKVCSNCKSVMVLKNVQNREPLFFCEKCTNCEARLII